MGYNEHPVWRSHGEEAKRGEAGGQFILWDCEVIGAFLLPWAPPRCPGSRAGAWAVQRLGGRRGRRPWHDRRGAMSWARADGGVVDVSRALAVSPRAPW